MIHNHAKVVHPIPVRRYCPVGESMMMDELSDLTLLQYYSTHITQATSLGISDLRCGQKNAEIHNIPPCAQIKTRLDGAH